MDKKKYRLSDGLGRQNIVLMSGIAIAPVAVAATSLENAFAISMALTIVAFLSVSVCRFIPRKVVYTIRVIVYALIAGAALIPTYLAVRAFYGQDVLDSIGVYLPILAVNPLILTKTETRFSHRPFHLMLLELAGYVTGFNLVCIAVGLVRELLVYGRAGGFVVSDRIGVPAASTVFGGLIIVGVSAGLFRWIYNQSKQRRKRKHTQVKLPAFEESEVS